MSNNRETLETCIQHQGSKIGKLINKFTNSPINFQNPPLHLSRELYKSNLFMQNEPNFKIDQIDASAYYRNGYGIFKLLFRRNNEAKRTQNEPNFSPKLGSFFQYWLCINGRADLSTNCRNGSEMGILAGRVDGSIFYKTISGKQLAEERPAKKALAQNLRICRWLLYRIHVMAGGLLEPQDINVLASAADWAWPEALHDIFEPRGVTLMVAGSADEFVNVLRQRRIHAAIIDIDCETGGLTTIRIIKMDYPRLPCLLLKAMADEQLLGKALELDVFSVLDKPIDMAVLQQQLNRLFIKRYDSNIFA